MPIHLKQLKSQLNNTPIHLKQLKSQLKNMPIHLKQLKSQLNNTPIHLMQLKHTACTTHTNKKTNIKIRCFYHPISLSCSQPLLNTDAL